MSNINVRVVGTANVTQMSGAFGKLEAQVTQLNTQLAQMVALQNGVDPSGYERMTRVAAQNSKVFRNAAASTGMFEVQQLKLNRATDDYIKKLQKQQMSFRELAAQRKVAAAAFKEQLAMEQMVIRQNQGSTIHGKNMLDVVYPKEISADLATAGQRLMFFNEQLKSGAHQMVNWGKNTQWAGRQLMVGFTMPIAAFGAASAVMAYQVDKELTRIAKVYDTTATEGMALEKELIAVRKQSMTTAIDAAKAYGSAGVDTLNVQAELAATGLRGAELQGYTNEIMRISTLGELEYADSIQSAISLQSVFNMSTRELTESFNYMNAVENATSLQTKDFAAAIPIAAAPVKAFGGDVKELGVLLTAMKERGIEATQGANAIKAAMQRLGRPSKQIQAEWKALTNTDITKIFDESEGLIDLFSRIGEATKDLDNKGRIKAFSGLFGTYQVTRMGALVEGMQDLATGTGQVSKAAELANASVSDLAKTAEQELARQAESLSGRWDRAFQELKLQMVAIGEPFLEVATVVVKAITQILDTFNGFPKGIKIIIATGIALAALAGPLVMLTGLFANLFANGMKVIAAFLGRLAKLMGATALMTAEQRAAAVATGLATTSMTKEATAAEMLTIQLAKLAKAQQVANAAAIQGASAAMVNAGKSPVAAQGLLTASMLGAQMQGMKPSTDMKDFANSTKTIADQGGKAAVNWRMVAGGTTAAAAGAAMLLSSTEGTVGQVAQIVFFASLLGPLLSPLAPMLAKGFRGAGGQISQVFTRAKTGATSVSGIFGGMRKGLTTLARAIGPAGWLILGLGTMYAIYSKIKSHNEAIAAMHEAQAKAIVSQNNLLNDSLDIRIRKQRELNLLSASSTKSDEVSTIDMSKELVKTPEGKDLAKAYEDGSDVEKRAIAMAKYNDVLNATGGTARKARRYLEAMFLAAGEGALKAQQDARDYFNELGTFTSEQEIQNTLAAQIEAATAGSHHKVEVLGTDLGKDLAEAMAAASTGDERLEVFNNFGESLKSNWVGILSDMSSQSKNMLASVGVDSGAEIQKMVQNYQAVADNLMKREDFEAMYGLNFQDPMVVDELFLELDNTLAGSQMAADNLRRTEQQVVKELASQLRIEREILTMKELKATWEFRLVTLTKENAMATVKQEIGARNHARGLLDVFGVSAKMSKEQELQILNEARINLGLRETGNLADGIGRATMDQNGNLIEQGNKHDQNNSKLRSQLSLAGALKSAFAGLNSANFVSAYQTGMEGVQQSIADDMRSSFDTGMNNALESRQAMWDARAESMNAEMENRSNAMDAAHERQQNALDAKWENRMDAAEAYWDRRVESVDRAIKVEEKAEEKRQKMFDAEIARINKLNDAMNTNIDFNVALSEGKFDEAAKIRNDAAGKDAQTALERASGAGSGRSAKRIEKLEGRRDSIEKAREKAMKALEKQQEAERRALQNSQEAQRRHLEKVTAMRQAALQEQTEADMEAQREIWENRKESLESQLEMFMSFIAGNEKQLKKHMKEVGLNYEQFEKNVIEPKGQKWGDYFGDKLREGMRNAGLKLASDQMWTTLGESGSKMMLKAMGFDNMAEFRHFVQTGEFKDIADRSHTPSGDDRRTPTRHEGGMIGRGRDSRKGVARGLRGLHPSETYVRAQKGEFIVNRRDAAKHEELLTSINSGRGVDSPVGGETPAAAALIAAGLNKMFMVGTGKAMVNAYDKTPRSTKGAGKGKSKTGVNYAQGPGGWHIPAARGASWSNSHDYATAMRTPLYAVSDGTIVDSRSIHSGGSSTYPGSPAGWTSYGETVAMRTASGDIFRWAHLSPNTRIANGTQVKGGTKIGLSGMTGNASGPHVHMDVNGNYDARGWLAAHGIGLKKGASEIKWDNTIANLHKGEAVLTEDLNRKFHQGVDNFANGGNNEYNVNVYVTEPDASADEIADKVINKLERRDARKPRGRRNA